MKDSSWTSKAWCYDVGAGGRLPMDSRRRGRSDCSATARFVVARPGLVLTAVLAAVRIVALLLGGEEVPERLGDLIVREAQGAEVRVDGDPLARVLQLALGDTDGKLQAGDGQPDEFVRVGFDVSGVGCGLGFALAVVRDRRVGTGQVVCGLPGSGAALPGLAAGTQALGQLRRPLARRLVRPEAQEL